MAFIGLRLDYKSGKNISFAAFAFCVSFWAFGDTFYYISTNYADGWFWYRFTSIGWCGMIFGAFYMCMEFADSYKKTPFIIKALVFGYSITLIIVQWSGTLFLKNFTQTPYGLIEEIDFSSPGFFLLHGGMLTVVLTGTFFLIKAIKKSKSRRQKKC
jgi:hypothetical protein